MSDIDTEAVDSLKVLDPNRPIREATKIRNASKCRNGPIATGAPQQISIRLGGSGATSMALTCRVKKPSTASIASLRAAANNIVIRTHHLIHIRLIFWPSPAKTCGTTSDGPDSGQSIGSKDKSETPTPAPRIDFLIYRPRLSHRPRGRQHSGTILPTAPAAAYLRKTTSQSVFMRATVQPRSGPSSSPRARRARLASRS